MKILSKQLHYDKTVFVYNEFISVIEQKVDRLHCYRYLLPAYKYTFIQINAN